MNKSEAEEFAERELERNGLSDWTFTWFLANRRLGVCKPKVKVIGIHEKLADFDEEFRETLLHEIAHALVGAKEKHNFVWAAKCVELGIRPERSVSMSSVPFAINYKFVAFCPVCNENRGGFFRSTNKIWNCKICKSIVEIKNIGGERK